MKRAAVCAALAALVSQAIATPAHCRTSMDALYCQDPAALMRVYPVWIEAMDLRYGGATPARLAAFSANQCWVAPAATRVRVTDERRWRARDANYQLARVAFDAAREHEEDRYSADGEYQGKRKVSYTGGWTFKKALSCGR